MTRIVCVTVEDHYHFLKEFEDTNLSSICCNTSVTQIETHYNYRNKHEKYTFTKTCAVCLSTSRFMFGDDFLEHTVGRKRKELRSSFSTYSFKDDMKLDKSEIQRINRIILKNLGCYIGRINKETYGRILELDD